MEPFMTLIIVALLIEAIVNIVQNVKEQETSWKYWAALGVSIVVAILVAVNWQIDIFTIAGLPEGQIPFVGAVLTGLILSRGANVVSDLIGLIRQ